MTCIQLGGACDLVFSAHIFEDSASSSQQHGKEMHAANDGPHIAAMEAMMDLMKTGGMEAWMNERRAKVGGI
jgi:hypothetical protein